MQEKHKLKIIYMFCVIVTFFGAHARAQDVYDPNSIRAVLDQMKSNTSTMRGARADDVNGEHQDASAHDWSYCQDFYGRLYAKPTVDFTLVLGSMDAESRVFGVNHGPFDSSVVAGIQSHLLENCVANYFACGFKKDAFDPTIYRKRVIGPDGTPHVVVLHLANSTLSTNLEDLEKSLKAQQMKKSATAEKIFNDGLLSSVVVFYVGHSRDGGGPDFNLARRTEKGRIDYPWYRKSKPGFTDLKLQLTKREDKDLAVLGVFGCDSADHFLSGVEKTGDHPLFIGTADIAQAVNVITGAVESLDDLLGERCGRDFSNEINSAQLNQSHLFVIKGARAP